MMTASKASFAVPTLVRLFGAALLLLSFTSGARAEPHARPVSIAEARQLPLGTVVTLKGSVTTPSGAFASSFFDQGFALQDRSAGIYVSLQTDLNLAPRAQVTVKGVLADSFGLLILVPASERDVKTCGKGPKVSPRALATGAVGEATEGLLVTVTGTISQAPSSDLPYGFKLSVNDGSGEVVIFVNLETGISVSELTLGQHVRITGFSSQFDDHYEIDPRSPADISAL